MQILYILAILIIGSIALFFLFTQSDLLPKFKNINLVIRN